jgi:hypothetical protein
MGDLGERAAVALGAGPEAEVGIEQQPQPFLGRDRAPQF